MSTGEAGAPAPADPEAVGGAQGERAAPGPPAAHAPQAAPGMPAAHAPQAAPAAPGSRHPSLWARTPHRVEDWFDSAALADARAYAAPLNRVRLARGAVAAAVTLAFIGGQAGPRLLEVLEPPCWPLHVVVALAAFVAASAVATVGFDAWVDLVHDRRHELSTQTPAGFVADAVKELALSVVLLALLVVPIHAAIRATELWWLAGWAIAAALAAGLALVYPVVIMPRFNRFDPLTDDGLRQRIEAVASRAGEQLQGVYVMDASRRTRRDNAFVAGFGPTKRVVLFDTILDHPHEVIEQIVAHEIGHYRLGHIPKSIALQAGVFLGVFAFLGWFTTWDPALSFAGVASIEEPGAAPLLLAGLGIGAAASSLVTAWYSRAKERQADLEALELLGSPEDFIEVWRRLAPRNRAELQPAWWRRLLASHPGVPERMAFGARWRELNQAVERG